MRKRKDLVEIFGYAPADLSREARSLWNIGGCPFVNKACIKINHDQTITYGTCSVTSPYGDIIICPNRLYANHYETLKRVANDAFGDIPFLLYDEYIEKRAGLEECVVALGKNSGKEVQVGGHLSMDWILARVVNTELVEYAGIEIQSIDITGNYRDAWHGYKNLPETHIQLSEIPSSSHGLNWANVHKRLIPQLIHKGVICSHSSMVKFHQVSNVNLSLYANCGLRLKSFQIGLFLAQIYRVGKNLMRQLKELLEWRKAFIDHNPDMSPSEG